MSLLYLSLTRWTDKPARVFTNAERLLEYRKAMLAEPCNGFDWERLRRQASQAANVVPIRSRRRA